MIQTLHWKGQSHISIICDSWADGLAGESMLKLKQFQALEYLYSHQVDDILEVYQRMTGLTNVSDDNEHFLQWLEFFEWDKIQLLTDGHLMNSNPTLDQLKHLAHELTCDGKLVCTQFEVSIWTICKTVYMSFFLFALDFTQWPGAERRCI